MVAILILILLAMEFAPALAGWYSGFTTAYLLGVNLLIGCLLMAMVMRVPGFVG